jgi:hypothetical protein
MKANLNDSVIPELTVPQSLLSGPESPVAESGLMLMLWPPLTQLYWLSHTTKRILFVMWCVIFIFLLLLVAFGIPGKARPTPNTSLSNPSGYPPAQMCR